MVTVTGYPFSHEFGPTYAGLPLSQVAFWWSRACGLRPRAQVLDVEPKSFRPQTPTPQIGRVWFVGVPPKWDFSVFHQQRGGFPTNRHTQMAMGQNPVYPVNIPIPTKIGSTKGGEFTNPNQVGILLVLTHSQMPNLLYLGASPPMA